MTSFLKNSIKTIILSITLLSTQSFASEVPNQENTPFTLPSDLTLWQDATNLYMEPVLTTQALKNQWQVLLDLTMPKDGNFDPMNPTRRATTIIQAFNKMLDQNEADRLDYLKTQLDRHKVYVSKAH